MPAGYGDFLLTSVLIVVLVLVLVWAVTRLGLKRFQHGPGTRGPIRVLAQTVLQQRHALHVVEVGGKTLLIGTSEQGMYTLAELDADAMDRELLAGRARPRAGFAAALQAALGGARWQRRDRDRGAAHDEVQESPRPDEPESPPTHGGTEELDPGMTDELHRVPMFTPPPASPAGAARRSRRHG